MTTQSRNYADVLRELLEVAPFRALSSVSQAIPRSSAILHPLFERSLIPPAARIMEGLNRFQYGTFSVSEAVPLRDLRDQSLIVILNHQTYLDAPIIGSALRNRLGKAPWFIAKKRLWDEFHYRMSFGALGALPFVRRSADPEEHFASLKGFCAVLRARQPLIVFPEGTIPGEIELYKKGICRLRSEVEATTGLLRTGGLVPFLAAASGSMILPVGISGIGKVLPPEAHPGNIVRARPKGKHNVTVRFGAPIPIPKHLVDPANLSAEYEAELETFANQTMMPAVSSLIDFSQHEVPIAAPLGLSDYERLREFERGLVSSYQQAGKPDHAAMIESRLRSQSST